ncbi:MAG: hypothetical protein M1832_006303 [Thelocarpon impressellum]|nr:MAG: hypothetical protein M1832_006303 [Thelocarpon impressellum]
MGSLQSPDEADDSPHGSLESGYASASSSQEAVADIVLTKQHLKHLNQQLQKLEPQDILRWCTTTLPHLYQTTAFGMTGLVTMDMLSRLPGGAPAVDLIFLDTLHHFTETLSLVEGVRRRYPSLQLHVYSPAGVDTAEEFAAAHGDRLWERDQELYDWVAKVEPAQRAYAELQVKAVLTGRRRSQGGKRGDMDIIEVDETGLVKVNPLANWSFAQVQAYVKEHKVPYNELLDRGYKSVGDWHSTQPIKEGEDERAGRWQGKEKTECGIHNPKSNFARFLREQERKKAEEELKQSAGGVKELVRKSLIPITAFALGTWQVQRLGWKSSLIAKFEDRLVREPLPLPPRVDPSAVEDFDYRRVLATGKFRHDQEMLIGPRIREGENGYLVVTPLERDVEGERGADEKTTKTKILVNRGWIPKSLAAQSARHPTALPSSSVTVQGLLRAPWRRNAFTPANAPEKGEFYFPDIKEMAGLVGECQEVWVEETMVPDLLTVYDRQAKGIPIGRAAEVNLRNNHAQYIFTW